MTEEEMKMTFTQTITRAEMKNKISMALKDPILQQGFEIICKENAELRKKLEQAKEIIKKYVNWDYGDKSICLPDITKQAEQFLKETDNDRKAD